MKLMIWGGNLAEKLGDSMRARMNAPLSAHDFGYAALQKEAKEMAADLLQSEFHITDGEFRLGARISRTERMEMSHPVSYPYSEEEQTVYKMDGNTLANYMKYNYKYDDNKRMIESEALKWNSSKDEWEKDLRINYTYEGKTVTTNYYKWNAKKQAYVLVPEMTVTMDNTNM